MFSEVLKVRSSGLRRCPVVFFRARAAAQFGHGREALGVTGTTRRNTRPFRVSDCQPVRIIGFRPPGARPGGPGCRVSGFEGAAQQFDIFFDLGVLHPKLLDPAHAMHHGGVVAAAEMRPISGSEREVSSLHRYIATCRGRAKLRTRFGPTMSESRML